MPLGTRGLPVASSRHVLSYQSGQITSLDGRGKQQIKISFSISTLLTAFSVVVTAVIVPICARICSNHSMYVFLHSDSNLPV